MSHDHTIEVSDTLHRFIQQSTFDFEDRVTSWLENERIADATGVCAACGDIVYPGGRTVLSGHSDEAEAFGLADHETVDLCIDCADSEQLDTLDYLDRYWGHYHAYRAERDAVAAASPDDTTASYLLSERPLLDKPERATHINDWLLSIDPEVHYHGENVEAEAIWAAVNRVLDASDA